MAARPPTTTPWTRPSGTSRRYAPITRPRATLGCSRNCFSSSPGTSGYTRRARAMGSGWIPTACSSPASPAFSSPGWTQRWTTGSSRRGGARRSRSTPSGKTLRSMADFARRLGRSSDPWGSLADHARTGFERFWNERAGHCYDVIDGPSGHDDALRPNQIFTVSLPESPLSLDRQRRVVDACARHLLTSYGLRSLEPGHAQYHGHYGGNRRARDGAYH